MVWAVDFQFDSTSDGRPIKIVSIIDEHTRECPRRPGRPLDTAVVLIDELDRLAADPRLSRGVALRQRSRTSMRRDGRLGW